MAKKISYRPTGSAISDIEAGGGNTAETILLYALERLSKFAAQFVSTPFAQKAQADLLEPPVPAEVVEEATQQEKLNYIKVEGMSLQIFTVLMLRDLLIHGYTHDRVIAYHADFTNVSKRTVGNIFSKERERLTKRGSSSDRLQAAFDLYSDNAYNEASLFEFIIGRLSKEKRNLDLPDAAQRLERLLQFQKQYGDEHLEECARTLFPEWSFAPAKLAVNENAIETPLLPTTAPATWKDDKQLGETPPDFIKRVYGEWLGKGLDRATVRRLDPSLGMGLDNWLRKNTMPQDVDLPTPKERAEREIGRLLAASETGDAKEILGNFTFKEARRIDQNIRRHGKQK